MSLWRLAAAGFGRLLLPCLFVSREPTSVKAGRGDVTDDDQTNPDQIVSVPFGQVTVLPPTAEVSDKDKKAQDDKSDQTFN